MPFGDTMDRNHIDKIAHTPEDRVLLAKLWDKISAGMRRNIMANTCFLSPRELEMARYLFGDEPGLMTFGGYEDAERKMLVYLPDYLDEESLYLEGGPLCCLRATFFEEDRLTHRDFLGALMGMGVERETVGDILPREGSCDIAVLRELLPFLLSSFDQAGRARLSLEEVEFAEPIEAQFRLIRDTLASLRLDALVGAGFSLAREKAAEAIRAGRVTLNNLECLKPDKPVQEGAKVSLRGMGKIELVSVGGVSRKNRTVVEIKRYI